ncbi:flavin monoamine oxidase family protein [Pseudomonas citronellolis]|uniref:flavin monoamine oxidase family protein n=1 Tax=Pseudomonas citronellolis TaxID=53408 RepID=UPI0023E440D0|nr:FAD-dependent oxidoreductase [Pseudomonas citronellolis]MDF3931819.1 FAD-dependent oxidoreductase [Pseudomonas citronellolis]
MHQPSAWYVTHWSDDPFSGGAYSTLLPGGTPAHRATLGACLGRRLALAGEACNPRAPAMTHGAWDDGLRAADLALAAGARRVLVVGAGCAGIAAARRLRERGVACVVLEARERLGGRTHSIQLGAVTVDVGAAWLQQFADNALADQAQRLGLALVETDFTRPLAAAGDGPLPDIDAAWDALRGGLDRSLPLAAGVARYLAGLAPQQARATRFAIDANLILEACLPLEQLSVDALDEEGVGNGDRFLPGGYAQLIERLAAGLDIRLGQPVTRIDWSADEVRVNDEAADFCICTAPLGALANLTFEPPLPAPQRDALAHLGMGRLEKVVLQFERRWWPRSPSGYLRWYDSPASWGEWLDLTDAVGVPTVAGLIAADAVDRQFAGRSDEQIALAARDALQAWAAAVEAEG